MRLKPLLIVVPACIIAAFLLMRPAPVGGATNVLVVQNSRSEMSQRIAAYYVSKRDIAPGNVVSISVPDSSLSAKNETITMPDYLSKIEEPIKKHMETNKLTDKVQYIVLTKGIPIKVNSDEKTGAHGESVDSLLAAVGCVSSDQIHLGGKDGKSIGTPYVNRYWRSREPFSHAKYGGYLVTRLDGYTEDDAKALVDRALAEPKEPFQVLLDVDVKRGLGDKTVQPRSMIDPGGSQNPTYKMNYDDFNADIVNAYDLLSKVPGVEARLDKEEPFALSDKLLTCYVSWGSNDGKFSKDTYHKLKFGPRSITETAVSTSGRTFLPTEGGQSLMADLIAQGAAGAKAYATEPFIHAMASPTVLLGFYTSGRNLAESYYASSRFLGWKDIVLGDPLCTLSIDKKPKEKDAPQSQN